MRADDSEDLDDLCGIITGIIRSEIPETVLECEQQQEEEEAEEEEGGRDVVFEKAVSRAEWKVSVEN